MPAGLKVPKLFQDVVLSDGSLAVLSANDLTGGPGFDQLQVAILSANDTPYSLNQTTGLSFPNGQSPDDESANSAQTGGAGITALPGGGMAVLTWGDADEDYDLQILDNSGAVTTEPFIVASQATTSGDSALYAANPHAAVAAWSGGIVVAWTTDDNSKLWYERFSSSGVPSGSIVSVPVAANGTNWGGSLAVDQDGNVIIGFQGTDALSLDSYKMYSGTNTLLGSGTVLRSDYSPVFVPVAGGGFVTVGYSPDGTYVANPGYFPNFDLNVQRVSTSGAISTTVSIPNALTDGEHVQEVPLGWIGGVNGGNTVLFQEYEDYANFSTREDSYNVATGVLSREALTAAAGDFAIPPATGPESNMVGVTVNSANQLVAEGLAPTVTAPAVTEALVSDTGTSGSDNLTSDPAITGTGDANATVTLTEGATTLGTVTADGSGDWTFTPTLADGSHTIVATETNSGGSGSASLTFTLDTTPPAVTEALVSSTSPTANPALNGGGAPDAIVTLTEGGIIIGTTTAGDSGGWTFTPTLADGPHTIVASETDAAGNTGSASVSFTLSTGATFSVHVYTDGNGDGVQDNGDTNLAGVTVALLDGSGNPTGTTAMTDSSGDASFSGLAPGSYEVSVATPDGDTVSQATNILTPNTLGTGGSASATVGVYAPATFSVHVYTDANADFTQDGGDTDLAGVTVNLLDGSGHPTGQSALTDANGNASFTGLPPASYEIQVVTPPGDTVTQASNILAPQTLSSGGSASATEGVYAPPLLLQSPLSLTVAEGASLGNLWSEIVGNGVDPDPSSLTITAVGTGGTHGAVMLDTADDSLVYVATGLDPSNPVDTFSYTLSDGQSRSITGTIAVTVTGASLPTTVATTQGATTSATGSGQRLVSEASGQTLVGSTAGGDRLFGGSDTVIHAAGNGNTVFVTPGNHIIALGGSNNTATLYDGNNSVNATGTGNTVTAGNGNNSVSGMTGSATITLGNGNDTITISGASNTISVGTGKDSINAGTGGKESVTAGDGANTIAAGGAGDVFTLGNGANKISATGASATISAGDGGNTVAATGAGDEITTGSGNDAITVTVGSATIKAGLGSNTIRFAGSGNVVVNQGGTDSLTDTGSNNTIVLPSAGLGLDSITGSVLSSGDVFDLRSALAATAWDQQQGDIGNFLTLGTQGGNALVQINDASGGTPVTVAVLNGAGPVSLSGFLAHALLT